MSLLAAWMAAAWGAPPEVVEVPAGAGVVVDVGGDAARVVKATGPFHAVPTGVGGQVYVRAVLPGEGVLVVHDGEKKRRYDVTIGAPPTGDPPAEQWIDIERGKSVVIETPVPIAWTASGDEPRVRVATLADDQAHVVGVEEGRTTLHVGFADGHVLRYDVTVHAEDGVPEPSDDHRLDIEVGRLLLVDVPFEPIAAVASDGAIASVTRVGATRTFVVMARAVGATDVVLLGDDVPPVIYEVSAYEDGPAIVGLREMAAGESLTFEVRAGGRVVMTDPRVVTVDQAPGTQLVVRAVAAGRADVAVVYEDGPPEMLAFTVK